MSIAPVITRAKFESLSDEIKALYKPVGDTFQLDLDETTLAEHIAVKGKDTPLKDELDDLKNQNNEFKSQLEKHQEAVNTYKSQGNKRVIDETISNLTSKLDLSDGRKELLDKLLEPKISKLLSDADSTHDELDAKTVTRELNSELSALKKISASTFVDKKDDSGGVRYEKQKGTITSSDDDNPAGDQDLVDYDNYSGNLSNIDYEHYMNNYFNKEEQPVKQ